MNRLLLWLFVTFTFDVVRSQVYQTTCAKADDPIFAEAAQTSCSKSCLKQNCGFGRCKKRGGQMTCVCARCAKGPNAQTIIKWARGK
ncbi:hypothetical protein GCK32_022405 [Trichostrongylus colubriformis]|uniref:Uncharacterized protein n=1 Tax=Trichostrongylus colubriformis TaxID=6319 RepID=A0AAN8FVM8_TRICO